MNKKQWLEVIEMLKDCESADLTTLVDLIYIELRERERSEE